MGGGGGDGGLDRRGKPLLSFFFFFFFFSVLVVLAILPICFQTQQSSLRMHLLDLFADYFLLVVLSE